MKMNRVGDFAVKVIKFDYFMEKKWVNNEKLRLSDC